MASIHRPSAAGDEPPRRSSLARAFMPFRSAKDSSPRSSIDSDRSSLNFEKSAAPRKLSKSVFRSREGSQVSLAPLPKESGKLRKKSNAIVVSVNDGWERDRVTGEVKDHTNMLHSLAHEYDLPDKSKLTVVDSNIVTVPAEQVISVLPPKIWQQIFSHLSLADTAALSLSSKGFRKLITYDPLQSLRSDENLRQRLDFLHRLNHQMPNHLLCYPCGVYHVRTQNGKESLKVSNVANPLFDCPHAGSVDPTKVVSKHRITFGRHLPYTFVQLAMRHHKHSPEYGISHEDLSRRYRDKEEIGTWSHQTRYAVIEDHLYMRVVSSCFAPPGLPPAGLRHLLYSREDFIPFFSVCAHWRDGELMPAAKCALSHIPIPLSGSGVQRVASEVHQKFQRPKSAIVSLCDTCKPLRRCPECPTEYLIEVRLQEDRKETDPTKLFKHALVVTRWSDLGDGSGPWNPEWAAINGDLPNGEYDSFEVIGRRAISGVFESFFNPEQIPPQRMMSLNPNKEKLGEKGHNWY